MSNQFVEILLSAALSSGSIDKINNQIKQIQKDIKDIDINLNVNGSDNKVFSQMESQIKDLQKQIKQLEGSLGKVGKGNSASTNNPFKALGEGANSSLKNIYELEEYIRRFNGSIKIIDDSASGKVKEVVTTIQNELGKIEKKVYRPVVDVKINDIGTSAFLESTAITDSKVFDQYANKLEQANRQLNELGRKGNVTAEQFNVLKTEISQAMTTTDIDKFLVKMKEVEQASSHSNKWTNSQENLRNQANQSIQTLEKLRDSVGRLDNADTSQFDSLINDLREFSNININKDSDIKNANNGFATLNKQINQLKNDTATYETTVKSLTNSIDSARHKGILLPEVLDDMRNEIRAINMSELNLDEKLAKVRYEAEKLNNKLNDTKRIQELDLNTQKARNELDKLNASLTKVMNSHKRTVDMGEAESIRNSLSSMSTNKSFNDLGEIKQYRTQLDAINTRILQLNANATRGARQNLGVIEAFKTAMERFPVWMAASTIFYQSIRSVQDLTEKVIELDTAMVNLRRVMDIPDHKFNEMLEQSIENVDKLSAKTMDYMKTVGEFGRTGMNDQESLAMANTSTMLQNISELTADEAFSSLTAAMIAFNIEAEDSISIADRLNEVDNNYAITTRDLSLSLNKAASTAKTFGVNLDELLGYTTAIGSATRESGNIVGNSLKTIMSRITTNSSAINALNEIGISINDINGQVKPASVIVDELAKKWNTLTDAQRQSTAVGVAGIYQLSRFNALMLNYDMAVQATETSINSFNSAQREQDKYNESLEGRINRLSNAWYGFSNAVGQSVLYDAIVLTTEGLNAMTDGATGTVKTIGILSPLFATLGIAVFALSGNLRTLVASTYAKIGAFATATSTNRLYMTSFIGLGAAANVAKVALQGLLFATGVGIAFAVLGVAIGKVTNAISENIQEQEKYETFLDTNTKALTENKAKTDELVESYKSLSEARNSSDWNSEKEKEYLEIQNQLAEIFPALVEKIDSTGQAHLKKSEAINKEIEATEKLVEAQNKLTVAEASETLEGMLTPLNGDWYESFGNFLSGSLEAQIKSLKQIIEHTSENGADTSKWEFELLQLEQQYQIASEKIKSHIYEIINAMASLNGTELDSGLSSSVQDFVNSLDLSNLDEDSLASFTNELGKLQIQLQESMNSEDEGLFNSTVNSLNELASKSEGFKSNINGFKLSYDDLVNTIASGSNIMISAEDEIEGLGEESESTGEKVETLAEKMDKLSSVVEQIVGVSQNGVDALADLLWQYDMLSLQVGNYTQQELDKIKATRELTSVEQSAYDALNDRLSIVQQLSSVYPDLLDKDGKAIALSQEKRAQMELENKANQVLLEAYKLSRGGKLTAEQNMTLASAQGTKARIDIIREELKALDVLFQKYNEAAAKLNATSTGDGDDKALMSSIAQRNTLTLNLDSELNNLSSYTNKVDTFTKSINSNTKFTKSNTSASKSNSDATKNSIYISDQYKNSLDKINLALEKQQKLTSKQVEGSKAHQDSLKKEINLQQQKITLMEKEAKSLSSQIKSGKIKQTGMISDSSKVTTTTTPTTTNRKLNGWSGRITDTYGTYRAIRNGRMHTGIDIAGAKGTRLDSNVNGKVVATGKSALSGNYVQILDDKGMKHFYGHLDKIVAKLGQVVTVGTQIGNIGNTGNSYGSHLHYEIKNAQGKNFDPMAYVQAAKKNQTVVSSSTSSTSKTSANNSAAERAQAIDQAKSELTSLQQGILNEKEALEALKKAWRQSPLVGFDNRQAKLDEEMNYENAKIQTLDKRSDRYIKTIDKQTSLLERKQKVNKEEIAYLEKLIKTEGISSAEKDEYSKRLKALKTEVIETSLAMSQSALSHLDVFDARQQRLDNIIDYERTKLEEVDTNSARYVRTLAKISETIKKKQVDNNKELKWLDEQIKSGKHSGDVLDELRQRYADLQTEMKATAIEAKKVSYEITMTLKGRHDEKLDDNDFALQRSKTIQSMYDEGSADWIKESIFQLEIAKKNIDEYTAMIKTLQGRLKIEHNVDDAKAIREELEDATLALYNWQLELLNGEKALDQVRESRVDDLVSKLIDSYKDYYEEVKEAHLKSIDDQMDAENKRHEDVMKNYENERKAFQHNINKMLRQLDRTEAKRDYNMEIDDLTTERKKIQDQINLLQFDNSNEAKSKRKKLQEELDKIDKVISERRHDRDIELQKQSLSDLVEPKNEEIDEKVEAEEEYHEHVLDRIDKEKEYWEQHYTDILNDERKFAKIREEIIAGNFENIKTEFKEFDTWLTATQPNLQNTLDGTMKAVGTTIRQNIIDNLKEALELLDKVNSSTTTETGTHGSSQGAVDKGETFSNPDPTKNTNDIDSMSEADMQVILAKFMKEKIVPTAKSDTRKKNIRDKANELAALGRTNGSTISSSESLSKVLEGFGETDIKRLSQYLSANSTALSTKEYQEMIKEFAESMKYGLVSLDTGGYIKRTGSGIDGKGGGLSIIHPNEVVNTPYDVDKLVQHSSIIDRVTRMMTPIINKLPSLSNSNSVLGGGDVVFNIHGDIHNSNNRTAKDLISEVYQAGRTKGMFK